MLSRTSERRSHPWPTPHAHPSALPTLRTQFRKSAKISYLAFLVVLCCCTMSSFLLDTPSISNTRLMNCCCCPTARRLTLRSMLFRKVVRNTGHPCAIIWLVFCTANALYRFPKHHAEAWHLYQDSVNNSLLLKKIIATWYIDHASSYLAKTSRILRND